MTDIQNPITEIRREAEYGQDKILLIMQFPKEPVKTSERSALCRDILAILDKELSLLAPFEETRAKQLQQPETERPIP